ncbi:MAG: hypothetical protein NC548_46685 [Lachnospiraceae bacterium]|nr:hypothetical protein [Lachnospiraceae bacterium]
MKKFFSSEFGFLHAIEADGRLWFNMTDLCSALRMALRDAKNECELANCEVREYNVRRAKFTSCNCYVDEDGMHTIIVESRKTRANAYRQWIEAVVCFSLRNPNKSLALHELELTGRETSYDVRKAYINQAKSNEALANALIEKFVEEAKAEEAKNKAASQKKTATKKGSSQKKSKAKPKPSGQSPQPATPQPVNPKPVVQTKPFTPLHGHMTVEEFFRNEIPYAEFCYYLDGLLADAQAHIVLLDEKKRWAAQHRINVVSVFEKMLKANAGDIEYQPKAVGF